MVKKTIRVLFFGCLLLQTPALANSAIFGQDGYFPMAPGNSWTYEGSNLTTDDQGNPVMMPAEETVAVDNEGVFHSEMIFSNGNTTTSDTHYIQNDALYIPSTHIVMVSHTNVGIPPMAVTMTATTTTDNTYSPPQLWFPSELAAGNVETFTGNCTTIWETVNEIPGVPMPPTNGSNQSTESIRMEVMGTETVTVRAGTFSAVKMVTTITVTEEGESTPYTYTSWYAEGVGMVKFDSINLTRSLVSWTLAQNGGSGTPGDTNGDSLVDLKDAILALKMTCRTTSADSLRAASDINTDGKIGIAEAVYALQVVAGTRQPD
jgi:hypothetical protein